METSPAIEAAPPLIVPVVSITEFPPINIEPFIVPPVITGADIVLFLRVSAASWVTMTPDTG